jgi:hypothetical protein
MPIQRRFLLLIIILLLATGVYGLAKYYAPSLVYFVVEQTLIEKTPPGTDHAQLRKRFHALISSAPDQNARMEKLFRISGYLEKIQYLTPAQLDDMMEIFIPIYSETRPNFLEIFPKLELFSPSGCLILMNNHCGLGTA